MAGSHHVNFPRRWCRRGKAFDWEASETPFLREAVGTSRLSTWPCYPAVPTG